MLEKNWSEPFILEFPVVHDARGNLTFVEGQNHVPFDIKRIYYLYDIPGGSVRGGHAHKELDQLIVAVMGSFDITIDNGTRKEKFHLSRSYYGLYLPRGWWREIDNFSSGSVCFVMASDVYKESDYYRDYNEFIKSKGL